MTAPNIVVDHNPELGMREAILKPLRAFNTSIVGEIKQQFLAIYLRDPHDDTVVGGLWGYSAADWLVVDLLFVPEDLRKQGVGTSLVNKTEEIARQRGCLGVWLHTGTFQAPGFYEKLGYRRFGKLSDYPRGHETIYFCKHLGTEC